MEIEIKDADRRKGYEREGRAKTHKREKLKKGCRKEEIWM